MCPSYCYECSEMLTFIEGWKLSPTNIFLLSLAARNTNTWAIFWRIYWVKVSKDRKSIFQLKWGPETLYTFNIWPAIEKVYIFLGLSLSSRGINFMLSQCTWKLMSNLMFPRKLNECWSLEIYLMLLLLALEYTLIKDLLKCCLSTM